MSYENSGAALKVQDRRRPAVPTVRETVEVVVHSGVTISEIGEGWGAVVIRESPSSGFWLETGGDIEVGPETSLLLAKAEDDIASGRTTPGTEFRKKRC
jgi:hypothetical protein